MIAGVLLCSAALWTLDADARVVPLADVSGQARVGGRPGKDVVVWIEGPATPGRNRPSAPVLDQRNLEFAPRVLAVRVGTRVEMPNNDGVFHNVFSFKDAKRFDLGLYPVGTTRTVVFDQPGLSRIFCNIHPNMAAYVMVLDAAHFAVSDSLGRFTISGVPAGPATWHAWRPGADELRGPLTVGQGELEIAWP